VNSILYQAKPAFAGCSWEAVTFCMCGLQTCCHCERQVRLAVPVSSPRPKQSQASPRTRAAPEGTRSPSTLPKQSISSCRRPAGGWRNRTEHISQLRTEDTQRWACHPCRAPVTPRLPRKPPVGLSHVIGGSSPWMIRPAKTPLPRGTVPRQLLCRQWDSVRLRLTNPAAASPPMQHLSMEKLGIASGTLWCRGRGGCQPLAMTATLGMIGRPPGWWTSSE
jgi:hypothetical protein